MKKFLEKIGFGLGLIKKERKVKILFSEISASRYRKRILRKNCLEKPQKDKEKIVGYLKNGYALLFIPGVVMDLFRKDDYIIGAAHVLTDGTWVWPEVIAYYVENYNLQLPNEFIAHLELNNWTLPDENQIDLELIADEILK